MIEVLKRYWIALLALSFVILLMLGSTLAVKSFGDEMLQDTNVTITPVGTHI